MILIPVGALWVMGGIWVAVVLCGFMLGWHAARYIRDDPAPAPPGPPPGRAAPIPPRRPFPVPVIEPTSVDWARWWPGLERQARPDTEPLSHSEVQISNWEKNLRRRQDAWMHERGMGDGPH